MNTNITKIVDYIKQNIMVIGIITGVIAFGILFYVAMPPNIIEPKYKTPTSENESEDNLRIINVSDATGTVLLRNVDVVNITMDYSKHRIWFDFTMYDNGSVIVHNKTNKVIGVMDYIPWYYRFNLYYPPEQLYTLEPMTSYKFVYNRTWNVSVL